jgi:hypothetical protein
MPKMQKMRGVTPQNPPRFFAHNGPVMRPAPLSKTLANSRFSAPARRPPLAKIRPGLAIRLRCKACRPWKVSTLVSSSAIRGRRPSGGLLTTASRQGDKTAASQDQAGKSSTSDGAGDRGWGAGERQDLGEKLVADDVVRHVRRMDNNVIEVLVRVRADGPS